LSASGLPSGASASFNSASGNATYTSICEIIASTSTPMGSYLTTVTGSGGAKTHTTTFTLTVNAPTPVGPTMITVFSDTSYTLGFMVTGNIYDDYGIGYMYAHRPPPKMLFPKTDTSRVLPTGQPTWFGYTHLVTVGGPGGIQKPSLQFLGFGKSGVSPWRFALPETGP